MIAIRCSDAEVPRTVTLISQAIQHQISVPTLNPGEASLLPGPSALIISTPVPVFTTQPVPVYTTQPLPEANNETAEGDQAQSSKRRLHDPVQAAERNKRQKW